MVKQLPLAKYDIANNKVEYHGIPDVVWASLLDKRYKIEVIRQKVGATFFMYDSENKDEIIHKEDVNLAYGAKFGPDIDDVLTWQDLGCKIVDEN